MYFFVFLNLESGSQQNRFLDSGLSDLWNLDLIKPPSSNVFKTSILFLRVVVVVVVDLMIFLRFGQVNSVYGMSSTSLLGGKMGVRRI